MTYLDFANKVIASRCLLPTAGLAENTRDGGDAGGCGVIGMACSEKIPARHLLQPLMQMRNRGNGKGGGIAAVGLTASEFGVSQDVLENDTLLVMAYLDLTCRADVESTHITPIFNVDHIRIQPHIPDYRAIDGLDVPPPDVVEYFVQPKPAILATFRSQNNLEKAESYAVEDEFVYQNTYRLNHEFYASTRDKKAFVLSHGKNLIVLKMVGYGNDVVRYYQVEDQHAHVWIGHHSYPTKVRVSHPGEAHPFIGLNEALVHTGNLANYASICEYLSQRNIQPLFLTDTEISAQAFDLLHRIYNYPLEYVIEALAPTTERDFTLLPPEKRSIYKMLQVTHIHASPDGPWFFLIGQSDRRGPSSRLIGITDTNMLCPQVFALQEGNGVSIGFAASEKHAIDAALQSLAGEDDRFWGRADRYWNTRGGSQTDGGAFIFTVQPEVDGSKRLTCTDKFGHTVSVPGGNPCRAKKLDSTTRLKVPETSGQYLFQWAVERISTWTYTEVKGFLAHLEVLVQFPVYRTDALQALTLLLDQRYPIGDKRRSSLLALYDDSFTNMLEIIHQSPDVNYAWVDFDSPLPKPESKCQTAIVDARGFPPEGNNSLSMCLKHLFATGFHRFIVLNTNGHRFIANGFGPETEGVRIDVYGSSGDYLGSGIDGLEIYVHNNGQDQLAQIMKSGKLVVYGDVGQTFMYCAKGGEAYVLGNAAGRALINAVGRPHVVINGTALDYLAESFMAGEALKGGGFVVLNGIRFDEQGQMVDLDAPYLGGNLFSLASGGALYVRDPHCVMSETQLNGVDYAPFTEDDWELILPYIKENERLFGINVNDLLKSDGITLLPEYVYRKIMPRAFRTLRT